MIDRRPVAVVVRSAMAALVLLGAGDAAAQPKRVVGFWMGPCEVSQGRGRALSEALGKLGWRAPDQVRIEVVCVAPNLEAAAVAAGQLAKTPPHAIVTQGSGATRALSRVTSSVPIVTSVGDPVRLGVAASLAKPGGNVTGLSQGIEESIQKQLEILRRLLPRLNRVVLVGVQGGDFAALFEAAGRRLGVATVPLNAPMNEVKRRFSTLPADGTTAVYLGMLGPDTAVLVKEANERKLPVMTYNADQVEEGEALVSYQLEWRDLWGRMAAMLDKVLRGTSPAELPFEQPTESFLAINRKTAAQLGIAIPGDLLLQANWTN